ncbi:hypothetical protein [Synechococcus phage Ssp-JY42]|nr:hypothetical protein [Synechococcus phage Yong-M4-211]
MTKTLSLSDLNARAASEKAFEFEYLIEGEGTGVFISVLGQHCASVAKAINAEVNDRRRKQAVAAARNAKARPDSAEYEPIEDDIAFGQRLAALRITGWRGIAEDFTPERALQLCQDNPDVASQALDASNNLANFMKPSPAK